MCICEYTLNEMVTIGSSLYVLNSYQISIDWMKMEKMMVS